MTGLVSGASEVGGLDSGHVPERILGSRFAEVDRAVCDVAAGRDVWPRVGVGERIALLDRLIRDTHAIAPQWVEVECGRKHIPVDSPAAGEEWFTGPLIVLRNLQLLRRTLTGIAQNGRPGLPGPVRALPNGRTSARVFPTDAYDRLLFPLISGEVWMQPGVSVADVAATVGGRYRSATARTGSVGVVLGAGNISSIPVCDALAKIFAEDQVVVLKLSRLTPTLGPVLDLALRALIEQGVLRIVAGGPGAGSSLVGHDLVESVHLTGSADTYDALVFGTGQDAEQRKAAGTPLLDKPITSELGNVTPLIVVPGPWSRADIAHQAEHIATGFAHNAGCNCISTRMMLTQQGWDRRDDLLAAVSTVLQRLPNRNAYYPGTAARLATLLEGHAGAHQLGSGQPGSLPWTLLTGLVPSAAHGLCREERFAPVLAETALAADSPAGFLDQAVEFCNDHMYGTLGATIVIHPVSQRDRDTRRALDRAITNLRYGAIGVNIWVGSVFGLFSPPWGAFPSDDPTHTQSGRGFVHNTYLFTQPEKTIMHAPFRLRPTPPWFVTHRRSLPALAAATNLYATRDPRLLPGLLAAALRP